MDGIFGKRSNVASKVETSKGIIPLKYLYGGDVDDKFLAKLKGDGKKLGDGKKISTMAFPRGNFLTKLKVPTLYECIHLLVVICPLESPIIAVSVRLVSHFLSVCL